jgi:lysophospholipase L1-like esterase
MGDHYQPGPQLRAVMRGLVMTAGLTVVVAALAAHRLGLIPHSRLGRLQLAAAICGGVLTLCAVATIPDLASRLPRSIGWLLIPLQCLGVLLFRIDEFLRHRPALRRLRFIAWNLFWITLAVVGAELVSRRLLPYPVGYGARALQPYLTIGDYYESIPDQATMLEREGPGVYGYQDVNGTYAYRPGDSIRSISDRFDFLFQDRSSIANSRGDGKVLRVFVLGGSVAYGIGASSRQGRWYAVLESALTGRLGRETKLIPAAMSSYGSTQERLALDLAVLPRRPDAVVILDGYNDVNNSVSFGCRPGDPYNMSLLYREYFSPVFAWKKRLAAYSHLYRHLLYSSVEKSMEANRQAVLADAELTRRYTGNIASVYWDNIRAMLRRCRWESVPCVVFIQPARVMTHQDQEPNRRSSNDVLSAEAYASILAGLHSLPEGEPVHDLTRVFDFSGGEQVYLDPVHFGDEGHRIVAEAMAPSVYDLLANVARR